MLLARILACYHVDSENTNMLNFSRNNVHHHRYLHFCVKKAQKQIEEQAEDHRIKNPSSGEQECPCDSHLRSVLGQKEQPSRFIH